jgi:hypothetical protein
MRHVIHSLDAYLGVDIVSELIDENRHQADRFHGAPFGFPPAMRTIAETGSAVRQLCLCQIASLPVRGRASTHVGHHHMRPVLSAYKCETSTCFQSRRMAAF